MTVPAYVVFSGGPDSTAAALWALQNDLEARLLTFQFKNHEQYGELKSAILLAQALELPHEIFDFKSPMQHFSSDAHVLMHAGTEIGQKDSTGAHRLEFGAGLILSAAANYAIYRGVNTLVWGATKEDALGSSYEYTQEFCDRISELVSTVIKRDFKIIAPLTDLFKHEIVSEYFVGREDLFAQTWSCKKGGAIQSGDCHASIARRVAARIAGIEDKTHYRNQAVELPFSEAQLNGEEAIPPEVLVPTGRSER